MSCDQDWQNWTLRGRWFSSTPGGGRESYLKVLGLLHGALVYRPKANLPMIFFDRKQPNNPKKHELFSPSPQELPEEVRRGAPLLTGSP